MPKPGLPGAWWGVGMPLGETLISAGVVEFGPQSSRNPLEPFKSAIQTVQCSCFKHYHGYAIWLEPGQGGYIAPVAKC